VSRNRLTKADTVKPGPLMGTLDGGGLTLAMRIRFPEEGSVIVIFALLCSSAARIALVQQHEGAVAGAIVAGAVMGDVDEPVERFGHARVARMVRI
jgi:hypothetical protein